MAEETVILPEVAVPPIATLHPAWDAFTTFLTKLDPHVLLWDFVGIVAIVYALIWFRRMHKSDKYKNFNLMDMFMDQTTQTLSGTKLRIVIASVIMMWSYIYLVLADKLTDTFTAIFISAFLADSTFKRIYGEGPLFRDNKNISVTKTESTVIGDSSASDSTKPTG